MANKANLANSVLFAPLSDSGTTLEVYTGDGSLFPAAPFYLTISPKNKWSRKINSEIVLVTAKSTDSFTITRAQKSTTAKAFDYGDLVAIGIYKEDFDDLQTSAVAAALQAMMPVGFVVTLGVSTNPATLYGFGTWTPVTGKVIVGKDSSGTFGTLNATGGAETHTLTEAQMPSHNHSVFANKTAPSVFSSAPGDQTTGLYVNEGAVVSTYWANGGTQGARSVGSTGGGGSHNNLQPYIVKYVWERTA